jgi:hypothetical protein
MVVEDAIAPAFIVRSHDSRGSHAGGAALSGTSAHVRLATTENCS